MQYLFQSALVMYRIARRIILPRLPLLRLLIVLHLGQVRQLPLLGQVCLHLGGAVLRGNGGLRDRLRSCCTRKCASVGLWPRVSGRRSTGFPGIPRCALPEVVLEVGVF